MDDSYIPISCAIHDKLVDLAVRKKASDLRVRGDSGEEQVVTGVIVDVFTRDGAEYLRLEEGDLIRLDRLVTVDGEEVLPEAQPSDNASGLDLPQASRQ